MDSIRERAEIYSHIERINGWVDGRPDDAIAIAALLLKSQRRKAEKKVIERLVKLLNDK